MGFSGIPFFSPVLLSHHGEPTVWETSGKDIGKTVAERITS
jgi:hypothetical protein